MASDLAQTMKLGMRRLLSGVSVLTARDATGADYAMTVSSVTSVSDAPASLLVCVQRSTRIAPHLATGAPLAINVLREDHQEISNLCAGAAEGEARFAKGQWDRNGYPVAVLNDAEAVFIARVAASHPFGTHDVVIAEITQVLISHGTPAPLGYLNGGYQRVLPG